MLSALKGLKRSLLSWNADVRTFTAQRALSREVRGLLSGRRPVKLVIGAAANQHYDGWLMTNLPVFDALNAGHWQLIFPPGSIDRILAEHVVEHWHEQDFIRFLDLMRPYLSPTSAIRLAVPDGFHPDPAYVARVRPGGTGPGSDDHKVLYTSRVMADLLARARFTCRLVEHFDEQGRFHRLPWSSEDGFIKRSADHDPRNKERPLSYTSLIVDAHPAEGSR